MLNNNLRIKYDPTINQTVNINAVAGTIVKSNSKSVILQAKFGSLVYEELHKIPSDKENRYFCSNEWQEECIHKKYKDYIILQEMLCGENIVLMEIIKASDFFEINN